MSDFIEICSHCGEPFFVSELGGGWTVRDLESIRCPICRKISSEQSTGGSFYTRELSDAEKVEHRERIEQLREMQKKRDTTT